MDIPGYNDFMIVGKNSEIPCTETLTVKSADSCSTCYATMISVRDSHPKEQNQLVGAEMACLRRVPFMSPFDAIAREAPGC